MSTEQRRGPKQSKWASWQQLKVDQATINTPTEPPQPEPVKSETKVVVEENHRHPVVFELLELLK